MRPRTLADWLALQESIHPQSIDMGLARVAAVARRLGVDRPRCPVITVAGTNGKGSIVAHLEALLRAAGAATGMFTSPHFLRYNERIRVDAREVEDAELIEAFERIESARGATTLTFFEYNTLAALEIFARRGVDAEVLEVGLGGRLDATNLVDADVAVVASIGFDHRDYLGDTLELIGAEKAGIFRPGRPAVLGTADMPASVFAGIAALHARPVVAGRDFEWREGAGEAPGRWSYRGVTLSLEGLPPSALAGSIQYRNAATALAAIEALGLSDSSLAKTGGPPGRPPFTLSASTVAEGLRQVRLAGRFQRVSGPVEWILDIAHNEPAARVFATHVRECERPVSSRTFAVIGILRDKDAAAIVRSLEPLVDHWMLCTLRGPRGLTAAELADRAHLGASTVTLVDSVEAGCQRARELSTRGDRVLVFGSVYTVGPALRWLGVESGTLDR